MPYHKTLALSTREFETLREAASQALGHPPSPMWHPMHVGGLHDGSHAKHERLQAIVDSRGPHTLARLLEAEHHATLQGGGLFHHSGELLKDVLHQVASVVVPKWRGR